jgi:hypothetical protein
MRRWLNENGAVVTVLALGLMVFSLFAIARQTRPRVYEPIPTHGYYADPATGEIFSALITEDPLPVAPSGQQAWRVHVFSCGNCESESERFVGWVERLERREGPPGFRPGDPMTAPGTSPAPSETSATTDPLAPPSPASPLATTTGDPALSTASPAAAADATHSATPTTPDAGQTGPTAQAVPGVNLPGAGGPGVGSPGFPRGPGRFGGGPGGWPRYRRFVRRPDDTQWVRARSEDGAVIMAAPQERCGPEGAATPCLPPQPRNSR